MDKNSWQHRQNSQKNARDIITKQTLINCKKEISKYRNTLNLQSKRIHKIIFKNKPDLLGRLARWIPLLQEFNYEVVMKPRKANSNADFLSRQQGHEAMEDISVDFPDEFLETGTPEPEEITVFHINGGGESEFQEIIDYLTERRYPNEFTREEKIMFQHKVAPYTLIRGVLFKMGADDQLRRCLEKGERKQVIATLHSGPSGGHFAAITTVNRIRTTGYWWPNLIWHVKAYVRKCDQC